jgi:hypothetical protein
MKISQSLVLQSTSDILEQEVDRAGMENCCPRTDGEGASISVEITVQQGLLNYISA